MVEKGQTELECYEVWYIVFETNIKTKNLHYIHGVCVCSGIANYSFICNMLFISKPRRKKL